MFFIYIMFQNCFNNMHLGGQPLQHVLSVWTHDTKSKHFKHSNKNWILPEPDPDTDLKSIKKHMLLGPKLGLLLEGPRRPLGSHFGSMLVPSWLHFRVMLASIGTHRYCSKTVAKPQQNSSNEAAKKQQRSSNTAELANKRLVNQRWSAVLAKP